jgi:hypothetical protein
VRTLKGDTSFWKTIRVAVGADCSERIHKALQICNGDAGSAETIEEGKRRFENRPDYAEAEFSDNEANNIMFLLQREMKSAKAEYEFAEIALKQVFKQINA